MAIKKYGHVIYADSSVEFKSGDIIRIPYNNRSTLLLHGYSGYTIYKTTMSSIYNYIPTNINKMMVTRMYDAGFIYTFPFPDKNENLKWLVLCALEEDCLVPSNITYPIHKCNNDLTSNEPECHRFDQSALNILLSNSFDFNEANYLIPRNLNNIYKIQRRVNHNKKLKTCINNIYLH